MEISIAMATHNGAKYLNEQLDSFLTQTRRPDELVVCDDASTDDTVQILFNFKKTAPFVVHIYRNPAKLGYAGNFGKALELCTGDLIFLSDQDDVWLPSKINRVAQIFIEHKNILLVVNDCELTNENLRLSGLTQNGQLLSAGLTSKSLVNGCCTTISSQLLSLILPIPKQELAHDNWIHKLADALDARLVVKEVLQYYRRHSAHTSKTILSQNKTVSKLDMARKYIADNTTQAAAHRLSTLERMLNRLNEVDMRITHTELKTKISNARKSFTQEKTTVSERLNILNQPRGLRVWMAFRFWIKGGYVFFSGWKSLAKDILK